MYPCDILYATRYIYTIYLQYVAHSCLLSCRFELYLRAKFHASEQPPADNKSGPTAVVRNMRHVLADAQPAWRLIVVDRFYTSVALLLQLLTMKIYTIGTIRTNHIEYCSGMVNWPPPRSRNTPRCEFWMARSVDAPVMLALSWFDKKLVCFLSTGSSGAESIVSRRNGRQVGTIKAPKLVREYHDLMGIVDRYDQLRLQRYSLHFQNRCLKYSKSVFLGLIDLVVVVRDVHTVPEGDGLETSEARQLHDSVARTATGSDAERLVEIAVLARTGTPVSKVRCVQSSQHAATLTDEWCGKG